jgi:hypothetical protein
VVISKTSRWKKEKGKRKIVGKRKKVKGKSMEKGIFNPAQPEFSNPDYDAIKDELV